MIKAVVFDIGGVTVKPPMIHVYKSIGKKFKINWRQVEESDGELDPLSETNKISSKDLWLILARKLGIEDYKKLKKYWLGYFKESAVLNKNVVKVIEHVKHRGYKVIALSNTRDDHEKIHREKGHYKFFDRVFLSNRLKMKKPDVAIYRHVVRKLNLDPSECVFIDDRMPNVMGARKAGMKAILFKNAEQLEKDLKKYL